LQAISTRERIGRMFLGHFLAMDSIHFNQIYHKLPKKNGKITSYTGGGVVCYYWSFYCPLQFQCQGFI